MLGIMVLDGIGYWVLDYVIIKLYIGIFIMNINIKFIYKLKNIFNVFLMK